MAACPAWTAWTAWSDCTASCGGGMQGRVRECRVPEYERGADQCAGQREESRVCGEAVCPAWAAWSEWTSCSASCGGGGSRARVRECAVPEYERQAGQCAGPGREEEQCGTGDCPTWAGWGEWTECSATCGGGERARTRLCLAGAGGECEGEAGQTETCNTAACPVWTPWSDWTECSASCGGGRQVRARDCVPGPGRLTGCPGDREQGRECKTEPCPVWTPWTEWSACSASCGGGTRWQVRQCGAGPGRAAGCDGPDRNTEECNTAACPVLTQWGEWSACSASCGGGERHARRSCVLPQSTRDLENNAEVPVSHQDFIKLIDSSKCSVVS